MQHSRISGSYGKTAWKLALVMGALAMASPRLANASGMSEINAPEAPDS